jgi:hypothetical protein
MSQPERPIQTELGELGDLEVLEEGGVQDFAVTAEEAAKAAKESPDFLNALALPTIAEYAYPPMYLAIWGILTGYLSATGRLFKYFALGMPRGFAKTSFIKLLILWAILFSKKRFILILSENREKAVNIIADVIDMLEEPNIKAIFGDWKLGAETDTQWLKKFSFRGRDIIIAGLGQGGSVRGLNIKNARPDFIVMDDVQSREDADSQQVSDGIYRWMLGTVMKAKSNKGLLAVFIANMYPTPHSILKKLKENPYWEKLITGGVIHGPDGSMQSLWEELRPLEDLIAEFKMDEAAGQAEVFYAEVLNDETASANNNIYISKVPICPYDEDEIHAGSFVVIDPATGKAHGDDVAIGYFEVLDAKPVLKELEADKFSPGATIRKTLDICLRTGCRLVVVEGNAYQSTLCYWFKVIMSQMGIEGITVVPMYSGKNSKNSRILGAFKELMGGETLLSQKVRTRVLTQARAFNPFKTNNDDNILDLLTYAPRVLTELSEYLVSQTIIEMQLMEAMQDEDGYGTELETINNSPA